MPFDGIKFEGLGTCSARQSCRSPRRRRNALLRNLRPRRIGFPSRASTSVFPQGFSLRRTRLPARSQSTGAKPERSEPSVHSVCVPETSVSGVSSAICPLSRVTCCELPIGRSRMLTRRQAHDKLCTRGKKSSDVLFCHQEDADAMDAAIEELKDQ